VPRLSTTTTGIFTESVHLSRLGPRGDGRDFRRLRKIQESLQNDHAKEKVRVTLLKRMPQTADNETRGEKRAPPSRASKSFEVAISS